MMHDALIIARYAWMRLWRGKSYWISVILAAAPVVAVSMPGPAAERWLRALEVAIQIVPLSAAIQLAHAVGEELESATVTYLWSRPMARSALLVGKLMAALPVVLGVAVLPVAAAWAVTHVDALGGGLGGLAGSSEDALAAALAATTLGGIAAAMVAAGIGALLPRHAFVVALAYLLFLDKALGVIPNVGYVSIMHHMRALAGMATGVAPSTAAIALLVLALLWLGVGVVRLQTLEATGGE